MTLAIDHEDRRDKLSMIAADLIGREGLGAVTFRNVAAAAGFSTKVVSYYFTDKSDLMLRVFGDAARRSDLLVKAAIARDPVDLRGMLEAYLPLDAGRLRDWRVFLSFWDLALSEKSFFDRQLFWLNYARATIAGILGNRKAAGLPDHADPGEAPRLLMIVQGIASQAIWGEPMWSADGQRAALAHELRC